MGEMRSAYTILIDKSEGQNHMKDAALSEIITFKLILKEMDVGMWLKFGNSDGLFWT
jgi:hypothetical protein